MRGSSKPGAVRSRLPASPGGNRRKSLAKRRTKESVGGRKPLGRPPTRVTARPNPPLALSGVAKVNEEGSLKDMSDLNAIADQLSSLTVMEAADLAKLLEEKWGVSAAAPVVVAAAAGPSAEVAAEEKTEFDAVLISFGDKKIQVIKEVRAITGLGLKEAKELVEGAPATLKEAVTKEEAGQIKEKIEGAGGQLDIK